MKFFADKNRSERELEVGDEVYLKLQPYRQTSVAVRKCLKLSSRYYGPFTVLEKIGVAAYKLQLPEGSRIHPVFHVKRRKGKQIATPTLPLVGLEGEIKAEPVVVLDRRLIKRKGSPVAQVLIRWSNLPSCKLGNRRSSVVSMFFSHLNIVMLFHWLPFLVHIFINIPYVSSYVLDNAAAEQNAKSGMPSCYPECLILFSRRIYNVDIHVLNHYSNSYNKVFTACCDHIRATHQ